MDGVSLLAPTWLHRTVLLGCQAAELHPPLVLLTGGKVLGTFGDIWNEVNLKRYKKKRKALVPHVEVAALNKEYD